jgi:hypothetical protein
MIQIVKRCPLCEQLFAPSKFHPRQQFCSSGDCRESRRKQYKSDYNRNWREQNPDYFKEYWQNYRAFK